MAIQDIGSGPAQLKAMVDLCHVYGIAVTFDVVYNHAGGFQQDDQCLYFFDRAVTGDNNQSLYFTDQDRGPAACRLRCGITTFVNSSSTTLFIT